MASSHGLCRAALAAAAIFSILTAGALAQDDDDGIPGVATTVQLPTLGVAIDAEGVLSLKSFADPGGRLRAERIAAARHDLA